MGLVFNRADRRPRQERMYGISSVADLIAPRIPQSTNFRPYVSADSALTHSGVWAAIRIRADLISTMPISAYRYANLDGTRIQVDADLGPFLSSPAYMEFAYSSQVELDRSGNSIGIILKKDGAGYPLDVELHASNEWSMFSKGGVIQYRLGNEEFDASWIWHEKQYTVSGMPWGLSPVQYAAYQLGQYKAIQDFATQWFVQGQGPRASLKNTEKKLSRKDIALAQETWRASQAVGEPFVHGNDWEYSLIAAQSASNDWLEAQKLSNTDIARFFNVPADVIDAAMAGGPSITYANIVQKNLQFLIMHLGPSIKRRENSLSQMLPRPRLVKLDTNELLRMDPQSRAAWIKTQIEARVLAPSEARAMDNRKPYTDDQIKEFELLGLNKTATGALAGAEDLPTPAGTQTEPSDPNAAQPDQGNSNNNGK